MSRAFDIRPGIANDDLRAAVAAINRVHGDGVLPTIPLTLTDAIIDARLRRADALFIYNEEDDGRVSPISIVVRSGAPNRRFLVLHEIGHLLDAAGLPGTGFASVRWVGMDDWRQAVAASRSYQTLRRLSGADPKRTLPLLSPDELWARAYAQFVAVRSNDATLLASLAALRRRHVGSVYYPRQWDDDDFVEIGRAIEDVLRGTGWIA